MLFRSILTEMSTELECINYVVTGIGINANTEAFPEEIQDVAASLFLETGTRVKRSSLIGAVMEAYEGYYSRFMECEDMSGLAAEYNSLLANRNNAVRVLDPEDEYTGTALGIDAMGRLLVRTEDGRTRSVLSGEVSVRGIYGYV